MVAAVESNSSVTIQTEEIAAAAAAALAGVGVTPTTTPQPPPKPLPPGWILRESRSQPCYYYYYNQDTGISSWQAPVIEEEERSNSSSSRIDENTITEQQQQTVVKQEEDENQRQKIKQEDVSENPRKKIKPQDVVALPMASTVMAVKEERNKVPNKRSHDETTTTKNSSSSSSNNKRVKPSKVRVLHILKKHVGSRKPTSWRVPVVTATRDEAVAELAGLLELLQEVQSDPAELRATMEELARTESDCSSSKRGGDLGFFAPKKMQPAFEEAAFGLDIGELSGIVETSSGVHVLLRIG